LNHPEIEAQRAVKVAYPNERVQELIGDDSGCVFAKEPQDDEVAHCEAAEELPLLQAGVDLEELDQGHPGTAVVSGAEVAGSCRLKHEHVGRIELHLQRVVELGHHVAHRDLPVLLSPLAALRSVIERLCPAHLRGFGFSGRNTVLGLFFSLVFFFLIVIVLLLLLI